MIKSKHYAIEFAFLFSIATVFLLGLFAYEYAVLAKKVQEGESEAELFTQAKRIIFEMERFNPSVEKVFYFPRYKLYRAALLKEDSGVLFSNLAFAPSSSAGYHVAGKYRYFVYLLPKGKYFEASFLVVAKEVNESEIYYKILFLLLVALFVLFAVYLYLIRLFEKPFVKMTENMDRFIKDSIHEINTPLAIITTNIELFAMKFGENIHLLRIHAASKSLASLYSDMEYLVKKDAQSSRKERCDLGEATAERVEYFTEIAQMKNIILESNIDTDCIAFISRAKVHHLIDNNLSNAIKYSHENSIIEIKLLKRSENEALLCFKDYGVGIDNPGKIFDRYYREELSKGGFGLGLNIVKNICDEEKIEIEVVSLRDEGSEFRYLFRLQY